MNKQAEISIEILLKFGFNHIGETIYSLEIEKDKHLQIQTKNLFNNIIKSQLIIYTTKVINKTLELTKSEKKIIKLNLLTVNDLINF